MHSRGAMVADNPSWPPPGLLALPFWAPGDQAEGLFSLPGQELFPATEARGVAGGSAPQLRQAPGAGGWRWNQQGSSGLQE